MLSESLSIGFAVLQDESAGAPRAPRASNKGRLQLISQQLISQQLGFVPDWATDVKQLLSLSTFVLRGSSLQCFDLRMLLPRLVVHATLATIPVSPAH